MTAGIERLEALADFRGREGKERGNVSPGPPTTPLPGADQALWTSTVAFTACFAVWTIFSIIGLGVKDELGLSETEFGLLVGTPILTGSLVRVLLGIWADQFGGRRVFALVMALAALGIFGAGNAGCPIALAERANGLGGWIRP